LFSVGAPLDLGTVWRGSDCAGAERGLSSPGRNWFGASSDGPTARSCQRSTRWSLASNCQVPNVTTKPGSRYPGDESEVAQWRASGPGRGCVVDKPEVTR
jgi:hypothetical protein